MKLRQGQTWKVGEEYVRIVVLERLAVEYKTMKNLETKAGAHHRLTKKAFCALLKSATLIPRADAPQPRPDHA